MLCPVNRFLASLRKIRSLSVSSRYCSLSYLIAGQIQEPLAFHEERKELGSIAMQNRCS